VLATRKSTPCTIGAIMLAMALPPAPPTPITLMRRPQLFDFGPQEFDRHPKISLRVQNDAPDVIKLPQPIRACTHFFN
jgi:hypothetical protein